MRILTSHKEQMISGAGYSDNRSRLEGNIESERDRELKRKQSERMTY